MFLVIYDLKRFFMHYKQILFTVILTLSVCIAAGVAGQRLLYSNKLVDPFTIAVVDYDNSYETNLLFTNLQDIKGLSDIASFVKQNEETAKAMLQSGEIAAYVLLPAGFADDIKTGGNSPLTVVSGGGLKAVLSKLFISSTVDFLSSTQGGIYVVLDGVALQNDDELYNKAFWDINMKYLSLYSARARMITISDTNATNNLPINIYYITNWFIFFCMLNACFVSVCFCVNGSASEKKLLNAGCSKASLFFSKIASGFIMHFILSLAILIPLSIAGKPGFLLSPAPLFGYFIFVLYLSVISALLSAFVKENRLKALISFIYSFASMFISGGLVPLAFLPEFFGKISIYSINYYIVKLIEIGYNAYPFRA